MTKKRPGTIIYFDLYEELEDYTDEEVGQLFRAILKYGLIGELPQFSDRGMKSVWRNLQKKIDVDAEKYDVKVLQRKYAAYCKKAKTVCVEPIPYEEWINEQTTDAIEPINENNESLNPYNEINQLKQSTTNYQLPTTNSEQSEINNEQQTLNNHKSDGNKKRKKDEDFEIFWSAYPKKKNKEGARKAFAKVKVPLQVLLDAIERQKKSRDWIKDGGQYIPYPSTWLNNGAWENEDSPSQVGFDASMYEFNEDEFHL